MKASLMTFTQTGNTLKVGQAISRGLQQRGFEIDHVSFTRMRKWNPDDADVIGIGTPCFEFRPPNCIIDFLERSKHQLTGKKVFIYITSSGYPMNTLWRLSKAVTRTGAEILGGIQIKGMDNFPTLFGKFKGRPNEDDLAIGEQFGHAIAVNIIEGKQLPTIFRADQERDGKKLPDFLSHIMYYVKKATIPIPTCDMNKCKLCGNCAYDCPTKNINVINKVVTFGKECEQCYRCWHICPENAIHMKMTPFNGFFERKFLTGEFMTNRYTDIQPGEDKGPDLYKEVISRRVKLRFDRKNPTAEYDFVDP